MNPGPAQEKILLPIPPSRRSGSIATLFLLLLALVPGRAPADSSPPVRVLLEEKVPRAVFSGASLEVERRDEDTWRPVVGKVRLAAFDFTGGTVRLDGTAVGASEFRIQAGSGLIRFRGRPCRGDITVRADSGSLQVVSSMPLESYLVGVVNGEIDSSWPPEAVKAQVVASRSYALYQVGQRKPHYDLRADVMDQVYAGVSSEDERAVEAVRATRGQTLYLEGELVQAFFHSSCGGTTASSLDAWGLARPALESVNCGQCGESPYARWNLLLRAEEIVGAIRSLHPGEGRLALMGVHRRSADGRVQTLFVETGQGRILVDGGEFRRALGFRRLPSTRFSLGMSGEGIVLTGEGYGHGVGLCQWGARGSALGGMDYRQILRKYYPGTEVRRAY